MRLQFLSCLLFALLLRELNAARTKSGPVSTNFVRSATISGLAASLKSNVFTCEQFVRKQLTIAKRYNKKLNAFIAFREHKALKEAAALDSKPETLPLRCVTLVVKDNTDVAGMPTTNGAAGMKDMTPGKNAEIVKRLVKAGAIVIGKANMAEMSDSGVMSNSTVGGLCANPWDTRRSCLGSSGGSAAAVAAGAAILGIGTDTEGSVIGPCTASGLFCIRPSQTEKFNEVRAGVFPAFSKQDTVGLMARSATDYLTAHDAIYGSKFAKQPASSLSGMKIRFLQNFYQEFSIAGLAYKPDDDMVKLHMKAAENMKKLGAEVEKFKLSDTQLQTLLFKAMKATFTKPTCSRSCLLKDVNEYLSRSSTTSPFHKTRDLLKVQQLLPATYAKKLNATLSQAPADVCNSQTTCKPYLEARKIVTKIYEELIGDSDLLAMPMTAKLPQLNEEKVSEADELSPAMNPYTGWPSASLPIGFTDSSDQAPRGLPVAVVLMAKKREEATLAKAMSTYSEKFAKVERPAME